ncbi:monooxygenase asqM [Colletotrichum spaethianum]|uniref:Monooxygenase asqM n=1 Tax=Colletotrichum spaethianum TaxID=700344 RepID=A0AA37P2T7_9PEZI|nr:monooxygenase asqM [Colletotrichum spaethianum]GKT47063.1 monooxygenase asqM [Colletotrichum spaethianum]
MEQGPQAAGTGCQTVVDWGWIIRHEHPGRGRNGPEEYKLVNRGGVFANSDGKRIIIQQMGDGSLSVYSSAVYDSENWASPGVCGYNSHDHKAVKKALLILYQDWSPELTEATAKATGSRSPRSLYILPVGFRWPRRRGITVTGDAAHLMTPFAGEGVNVALEDAMKLAKAIIPAATERDQPDLLDQKIKAFEKEIFARMEKVQRLAEELMRDYMFTPGSPRTTIATSTTTTSSSRHRGRCTHWRLAWCTRTFSCAGCWRHEAQEGTGVAA